MEYGSTKYLILKKSSPSRGNSRVEPDAWSISVWPALTRERRKKRTPSSDHLQERQVWGKAPLLAEAVWGRERGICHSIPRWRWCFPYCQTDGLHKPGRYWQELCVQRCWWTCSHWRHDDKMKAWVDPYVRLLNVELELPRDELPQPPPPPPPPTSATHSARWNASLLRCWKLLVRKEFSW